MSSAPVVTLLSAESIWATFTYRVNSPSMSGSIYHCSRLWLWLKLCVARWGSELLITNGQYRPICSDREINGTMAINSKAIIDRSQEIHNQECFVKATVQLHIAIHSVQQGKTSVSLITDRSNKVCVNLEKNKFRHIIYPHSQFMGKS